MKSRFVSKAGIGTFSILSMLLSFTSCEKDKDNDSPKTITDVVSSNPNFSLLKSAVVKADLATTLSGTGPFTVFAPDDDAFASSGITSSVIAGLSADQLKAILLYHTLGSKVMAANVPAGPNAAVTTAGGGTVYVTKNAKGVFVNGWKVTAADIGASNGVIHSIEHLLMPPAGNLVEVAQANSNLTYLVAAVIRASQGSANVAAVLTSAGPLTVFAPTNQAFIDAGFPTVASIQAANPNTLASILTYHVVAARTFSSDLSNGQSLTTANGGSIIVGLGSNATVKGNSNTSPSNITAVNIMATNGVVHVIDKVLLP
ncbi:fasciclin domain-containing protein [Chitinophaga barathri]|uniref:Fasciclin domain-containing protein n=1 Tax=Chitinophaga barathri TaxID=1647451 RepID=A0A3N4N5R7_9BACT|nr:fasciclin domain-containing protein [Chitinophaga barathri]RPD42973.1 fasciclin domain-containing protein [Chitinophaga barathri]